MSKTPFLIRVNDYEVPAYIQTEIHDLVISMCFKIEKNQNKPCPESNPDGKGRDHRGLPLEYMFNMAMEEIDELFEAIQNGDYDNIQEESADVANIMAFIHGETERLKNGD